METDRRYQETLDYLYSFVDYSLTRQTRYTPEKFDLGRMHAFMQHFGDPHHSFPSIHIAGTKGKGSTAALCASVLQTAGYRVGLYTSPHLQDYAERIQVDREHIPHQDLVEMVDEIRPYLDAGTELTTFELTTGIAFLYFRKQGVQAAVVEVGLGGRLDATNVVTPLVAVITSLSHDHTNFLGETLAEIAGEKGGIIKAGVPLVLAPQKDEARLVIERIAAQRQAPLIQVGRDILFAEMAHSLSGQSLLVWSAEEQELVDRYIEAGGLEEWEPTRLQIPLLGYHQVENAATAYTALKTASNSSRLSITEADIQRGFQNVSWPGRFEILNTQPPVVIDSAHNRYSALKLRLALDDYFPGRPVVLVFGASEDKDVEGMFAELMPRVRRVIATRSYHPRSLDPEALKDLAHRFGRPVKVTQDVSEAMLDAVRTVDEQELVLVTGSLFVAAGARETWYNLKKQDEHG